MMQRFMRSNEMTYLEVAEFLENFIEDRGSNWALDDYLSATTFEDPYLQEVQRRVALLDSEFPADKVDHYCGPGGVEVIRQYIQELRSKAVDHL